jgi:hypothetical protein
MGRVCAADVNCGRYRSGSRSFRAPVIARRWNVGFQASRLQGRMRRGFRADVSDDAVITAFLVWLRTVSVNRYRLTFRILKSAAEH